MRRWIARLAIAAVIVGVSLRWVRELQAGHQQDFLVYVNAARDWLAGRSLYVDRPALPYTYPPVAALLFLPFAPLPDGLVMAVWVVLNLGLGAWLTRRLFPGQPWWLLALVMLSAPIGRSIYLGQINLVLFALLLLDLVVRAGSTRGVLLGAAAAIKVTPAWMGLTYLLRRDWRRAVGAAGSGLGLTLIAWLVRPGDSQTYWTQLLWDSGRMGGLGYADNQSVTGLLARLVDTPSGGVRAAATAAVLTLAGAAVWRWRHHPASLEVVTAVGLAGLLASPVAWTHHWLWLLTFVAVLLHHGRANAAAALAAVLCIEPLLVDGVVGGLPRLVAAVLLSTYTFAGIGALAYLAATPPGRLTRPDSARRAGGAPRPSPS